MAQSRNQRKFGRTKPLLAILILVLIGGGIFFWYRHVNHKKIEVVSATTVNTSNNSDKNATGGNVSNPPSTSSSNNSSKGQTTSTGNQTTGNTPQPPSGNFVSNHEPGANGSPEEEQSVCNVRSGVTCSLSFTKGNVTKSLNAQVASSTGSVSWDWTPSSIGLTTGSWTITATASLDGYSSSTQDKILLEVQ